MESPFILEIRLISKANKQISKQFVMEHQCDGTQLPPVAETAFRAVGNAMRNMHKDPKGFGP